MDSLAVNNTKSFVEFISKTDLIPTFLKKQIKTAYINKDIIFTNKIYDSKQLVVYYGPHRKFIVQIPKFRDYILSSDLNVNLAIVSGITGRAVLKYADIYGIKRLYKLTDEMLTCYFGKILYKPLLKTIKKNYIARNLAEYWASIYVDMMSDVVQYYFRSGKIDPIILNNVLNNMKGSLTNYIKNEMDLPTDAETAIVHEINYEMDMRIFLDDILDSRYLGLNDIKKAFKECLEFPFDTAPLISYVPGRELRIPLEIFTRLLENIIYAQVSDRYSYLVKFFSKVI